MAGKEKQYDFKVVQTNAEFDDFLYKATIQPEYQRDGLELTQTGRYHVILLWPLGTVHFMVYKNSETNAWDIDDVEEDEVEEPYTEFTGNEEEAPSEEEANPLSLESIIPDVVLETIGNKIESEYITMP